MGKSPRGRPPNPPELDQHFGARSMWKQNVCWVCHVWRQTCSNKTDAIVFLGNYFWPHFIYLKILDSEVYDIHIHIYTLIWSLKVACKGYQRRHYIVKINMCSCPRGFYFDFLLRDVLTLLCDLFKTTTSKWHRTQTIRKILSGRMFLKGFWTGDHFDSSKTTPPDHLAMLCAPD